MPKVAYSKEDKAKIKEQLVNVALELMAKQGIQHTKVEQIYSQVGISKSFFYSFFPTKEDLIVETLYLQQPRIIEYARKLMQDSSLNWNEAVKQFLVSCCYGEKNGIAVLTIEEQQLIFKHLSEKSSQQFRMKQQHLFKEILLAFEIDPSPKRIQLFTNLSLSVMILCKAMPENLPLFVPDVAKETIELQIDGIINVLKHFKENPIEHK